LNVFGVPPPVGVPNTGVGAPVGVLKLALAPENEGMVICTVMFDAVPSMTRTL
jgi:hypothetical protein